MVDLSSNPSMINLNLSGRKTSVKRQRSIITQQRWKKLKYKKLEQITIMTQLYVVCKKMTSKVTIDNQQIKGWKEARKTHNNMK